MSIPRTYLYISPINQRAIKNTSVKESITNCIFTIERKKCSLNIHIYIATLATLELLLDKSNHLSKAGKIFINTIRITHIQGLS